MHTVDSVKLRGQLWLVIACLVLLPACKKQTGFRKTTVPVTGQVRVDGEIPSSPVQIRCTNLGGIDQEHPTVSSAITGEGGTFSISTYESGDGVPEGDYVLTFEWKQMNLVSMSYGGPDQLKGRYSDAEKSDIRFTVDPKSKAIDLGTIELKTKD